MTTVTLVTDPKKDNVLALTGFIGELDELNNKLVMHGMKIVEKSLSGINPSDPKLIDTQMKDLMNDSKYFMFECSAGYSLGIDIAIVTARQKSFVGVIYQKGILKPEDEEYLTNFCIKEKITHKKYEKTSEITQAIKDLALFIPD